MQKVVSVAVMRQSDAETIRGGIPGRELMFSAGRGVLERHAWKGPVAIVAGSGNNGGDGYVLALLLKEKSIPCTVFLLSDRFSEDGRYYYEKCLDAGVNFESLREITDSRFAGMTFVLTGALTKFTREEATEQAPEALEVRENHSVAKESHSEATDHADHSVRTLKDAATERELEASTEKEDHLTEIRDHSTATESLSEENLLQEEADSTQERRASQRRISTISATRRRAE